MADSFHTMRTTIVCQNSGWMNCYKTEEQLVNSISLINKGAANAATSASGNR